MTTVSDELDAATVERCAQWHDEQAHQLSVSIGGTSCTGPREQTFNALIDLHHGCASAIRSLIPNSAGDARTTHLQGEGEPVVKQVPSPAGTVSEADICSTLCKAHGTAQCAAICMSHSSLHTTDGCCPEAKRVWAHKARALLSQFDVRRK